MSQKILVVDDEDAIREEIIEYLTYKGYDCVSASGTGPALEALHGELDISVILTDLRMPGRNGLELISTAQSEIGRELEFIVLTGHGSQEVAIDALRLGAQDFIEKPVNLKHLLHVVQRSERLIQLKCAERLSRKSLVAEVESKTVEVRSLYNSLETAYEEALNLLADAAEYKDPETGAHIKRIGSYSRLMAMASGWPSARQSIIELAAPLHDVGKIGTPDTVLLKPGKLDTNEFMVMKQHTEIGHKILSRSSATVLRYADNIAWAHHERWDGSGYPRGLKGDEIPIEARIVSLADIYDALRSERPYKPAFDHEETLGIILDGDGRTMPEHFDPKLHDIFRANTDAFGEIFSRLAD
ncbi:MAG: HD domain-containing phosphohydrolase [Pseudomonadota bacterium]